MTKQGKDGAAAVLDANTPTDEVIKAAQARTDEQAFGREESSISEENASDTTGEVEKAQAENEAKAKDEANTEAVSEDGGAVEDVNTPIPYKRFNSVIKERNTIRDELKQLKAQADEMSDVLNDPDVLRTALSKQGWKPEKIEGFLKERGFEQQKQETKSDDVQLHLKELAKDLDLSTTDGWAMYQYRIAKLAAENMAKEKISEYDKSKTSEIQAKEFISTQEKLARELSEKVYQLPYGEPGKDDVKRNMQTAIGRIATYLDKNPEDAYLGHAKLLKLAMSEEAFKKGEDKGVVKERERHRELKSATLEGEEETKGEETPNSSWSVQRIIAWRRAHPNA